MITPADKIMGDLGLCEDERTENVTTGAIRRAATAIAELQLAITAQHDEIAWLRQTVRDQQHEHDRLRSTLLLASGHGCDARQRCAKCGIPTADPRRLARMFSEMHGWVGALCPTCANHIEAEFDGDPKIARADGDVL